MSFNRTSLLAVVDSIAARWLFSQLDTCFACYTRLDDLPLPIHQTNMIFGESSLLTESIRQTHSNHRSKSSSSNVDIIIIIEFFFFSVMQIRCSAQVIRQRKMEPETGNYLRNHLLCLSALLLLWLRAKPEMGDNLRFINRILHVVSI